MKTMIAADANTYTFMITPDNIAFTVGIAVGIAVVIFFVLKR
jgi:hypothetical protein